MTVNLINDVLTLLDTDDALLTAEAASIQAQIDALLAQLALIQQAQADSARFRQLALDIQSGAAYSSVVVPGAPTPTGPTTPLTPGITGN
jgi:hypothetical protein